MGGYGSGRWGYWHTARPVAEQSLAWPIRTLYEAIHRVVEGGSGWRAAMHWSRGERQVAAAGYAVLMRRFNMPEVVLEYRYGDKPITDLIRLTATGSNLPGNRGRRWWWVCPSCGRRVGNLYAPGCFWRCRHCYNITYTSSNESDKRVSAIVRGDFSILGSRYSGAGDSGIADMSADLLARLTLASSRDLILLMKANDRELKLLERKAQRLHRKR